MPRRRGGRSGSRRSRSGGRGGGSSSVRMVYSVFGELIQSLPRGVPTPSLELADYSRYIARSVIDPRRRVAVIRLNRRIIGKLDRSEARFILAHELAHVVLYFREGRMTTANRMHLRKFYATMARILGLASADEAEEREMAMAVRLAKKIPGLTMV